MIISRSAEQTVALGCRLAEGLRPGSVVALYGELGAGKTCFVKGIAQGLGVAAEITSPTFTLVHEHLGGRLPLYHVDLYRVDDLPEALQIGIEDYLWGDGVTVIEWAEKIESVLPPGAMRVRLTVLDETTRRIELG